MRNISFALTTPQFKARTKFVTRRLRWIGLEPNTILMGVEKAMGLRKGQKIKRLGKIRVLTVTREALNRMSRFPKYGDRECQLEGFPEMNGAEFVQMFCKHNACTPETVITRITFEYL